MTDEDNIYMAAIALGFKEVDQNELQCSKELLFKFVAMCVASAFEQLSSSQKE